MSVTVNNSPIQVYSCTYNFTQLIMLNPLWNDSWIQTFHCFILYKLPHLVVHITLKRWMPWTSKFLHVSYRIIVLSIKYVVTISVSTEFTWWLQLIALSWLPYAFMCCLSCGSIFFRHNSWLSSIVDGLKNYFVQELVFYLLSRLYKKYVYSSVYILWSTG